MLQLPQLCFRISPEIKTALTQNDCFLLVLILHIQLTTNCCCSNVQEQCWVWPTGADELFYDKYEWVRIRVEQEHWHDQSPLAPHERESAAALERQSPYSITVSCTYILRPLLMIVGLHEAGCTRSDLLVGLKKDNGRLVNAICVNI